MPCIVRMQRHVQSHKTTHPPHTVHTVQLVPWSVSGKESQPRRTVSARQLLVKQIDYFSRLVLLGAIRVNGLGRGGSRSGGPGAATLVLRFLVLCRAHNGVRLGAIGVRDGLQGTQRTATTISARAAARGTQHLTARSICTPSSRCWPLPSPCRLHPPSQRLPRYFPNAAHAVRRTFP